MLRALQEGSQTGICLPAPTSIVVGEDVGALATQSRSPGGKIWREAPRQGQSRLHKLVQNTTWTAGGQIAKHDACTATMQMQSVCKASHQ